MTKTQSDCILNGCFIKPMNENIAVLLPVHSPRWVLGIGIRMHWEKCGEILFFSKILCFLGKCEENLVFLKKFSIFLKSLYSHFEKMWRKYCPFLQNWDFFSKLIFLLKFFVTLIGRHYHFNHNLNNLVFLLALLSFCNANFSKV